MHTSCASNPSPECTHDFSTEISGGSANGWQPRNWVIRWCQDSLDSPQTGWTRVITIPFPEIIPTVKGVAFYQLTYEFHFIFTSIFTLCLQIIFLRLHSIRFFSYLFNVVIHPLVKVNNIEIIPSSSTVFGIEVEYSSSNENYEKDPISCCCARFMWTKRVSQMFTELFIWREKYLK